ncbi:hypothetical protein P3T76_014317 [Phytophthora citrophthora]|uniref:Uncharacterized protein n=1 Tax=Phytophthora citrophthora TaxID=4793 RepID=A0AAD9LB52_9STRA|nr:hypothetical protein P3T76_014317 [Phytophthora citrophthora]
MEEFPPYHKSAQVLFGQTWRVFTSQWEKLFSQGMAASCRQVQLIDDDNIRITQPNQCFPVSRISTSTGFLITHRGLQRDSVEIQDLLKSSSDDQQSEIWLEHFCW